MRFRLVVAALAITLPAAVPATAQRHVAFEFGSALFYETETVQLGVRFAATEPVKPAFDFAVAVLPEALSAGGLVTLMDLDVAAPQPIGPSVRVAPRLGLTVLLLAGSGGAGASAGFNLGAGLITRVSARSALRLDYTWRRMGLDALDENAAVLSSITFGFALGAWEAGTP